MNNLASLKSELLQEYTEERQTFSKSKNYYEHHNLPLRTYIKSSEARLKPSNTKTNFQLPT